MVIAVIIILLFSLLEISFYVTLSPSVFIWFIPIQSITAIFGFLILQKFQFNNLFFVFTELQKQQKIVFELWEETLWIFSGILCIVPGFLTDFLGILLMFSFVRKHIIEYLLYNYY